MTVSVDLVVGYKGQDGSLLTHYLDSHSRDFIAISRRDILVSINNHSVYYPISSLENLLRSHLVCRIFFFSSISQSFEDPVDFDFLEHYDCGISLLVNILNVLRLDPTNIKPRVLFASSALVLNPNIINTSDFSDLSSRKVSSKYTAVKTIGEIICNQLINDGYEAYTVILFNHESCYRKPGFLFHKLIKYALSLNHHLSIDPLTLFSPNLSIDVGYAPEYMYLCTKLIDSCSPGTYTLCTENVYTISDYVSFVKETLQLHSLPITYSSDIDSQDRVVSASTQSLYDAIQLKPQIYGLNLIQKLVHDFQNLPQHQ